MDNGWRQNQEREINAIKILTNKIKKVYSENKHVLVMVDVNRSAEIIMNASRLWLAIR